MSVINVLQNRRKFLKLSAMGAGGILALSGMLESCKDHDIPNPNGPVAIPHLGDYQIDWSDAAKTALTTGFSLLVPEGGELISAFLEIFWPKSGESPWDQVKEQVEAVVDQKLQDFEYATLTQTLKGLNSDVKNYASELNIGKLSDQNTQWIETRGALARGIEAFQVKGYELASLGLYVQVANMYLAVLRDAVILGKAWERSEGDQGDDITNLQGAIQDATNYVTEWYQNGRTELLSKTKFDYKNADPFRTVNAYDREMALMVLDFRDTWAYFDITKYPSSVNVISDREIFTDPMGQGVNPDIPFKIVTPPPTQFPNEIEAWSGKYFNAIRLTYPQGGGPAGVTKTPRYGSQEQASTYRDYPIDKKIVKVDVSFGSFVNTILFYYSDGSQSDTLGANEGPKFSTWEPTNSALSSVMIQESAGPSHDNAAALVVFGFQYWQSSSVTLQAVGKLYITSPKEKSEADFHKAFPSLGISAGSITNELKAARQAYWASFNK